MADAKFKGFSVTIKGMPTVAMLQNQYLMDKKADKKKGETLDEQDQRIWPTKAYSSPDGQVCIPSEYIEAALIATQKREKYPIKPKSARSAGATAKDFFKSSLFITENLIPVFHADGKPYLVKDLLPFKHTVVIQRSRIVNTRPMLIDWQATFEVTLTTNEIDADDIRNALEYAGSYIGIGDWRPKFGRFNVIK